MIRRSSRPSVDIWHKLVNSFSLKSFLKCQAQIKMHFVNEGELVNPFSTPGTATRMCSSSVFPGTGGEWLHQVIIYPSQTSQQVVTA